MRDLLIVRHGEGLGRLDHYLDDVLVGIRQRHPDLWPRIRVHDTGSTTPSLDHVGAVYFAMGDPLERLYPACYAEAMKIVATARRMRTRILQKPEVLAAHSRGRTAQRLAAAGVRTPEVRTYESLEELRDLLDELALPVLLRAEYEHSQSGALVVRSEADARVAVRGEAPVPGAVATLLDTRHRRRSTPGPDPFRRWYHRYRAFVFGGRCIGGQLYFGPSPIVSSDSSIWEGIERRDRRLQDVFGAGRLNGLVKRAIRLDPWYRRALFEELSARARSLPDAAEFERAAAALDLDFVAFDCSRLADGKPIIWEANPYPYFQRLKAGPLGRERQLYDHVLEVQEAVIAFFRRSLRDPGPGPISKVG
jgi:hypothetical protein